MSASLRCAISSRTTITEIGPGGLLCMDRLSNCDLDGNVRSSLGSAAATAQQLGHRQASATCLFLSQSSF